MRKIEKIQLYQGISFGGGAQKGFAIDQAYSDGVLKKHLTIEAEDKGIVITSPNECVLIPWNNVCYIKYVKQEAAEPAKPKAAKSEATKSDKA